MRLTAYCATKFDISKRLAKTYLKSGKIVLNDVVTKTDFHIDETQDIIHLNIYQPNLSYDLSHYLIQQTDQMVFFYKPPYMHTERHTPEDDLTIEDMIKTEFPDHHLITRLDNETDGVIAAVHHDVTVQQMSKTYLAIVHGRFEHRIRMNNRINAAKRKKVKVLEEQSPITTSISPYQYLTDDISVVKVTLEKAARHQIRAYLAHLGHPIWGDDLYGNSEQHRLMLHCMENRINSVSCTSERYTDFLNFQK